VAEHTYGCWISKVGYEMFQRIRQYSLIDVSGRWYRPRAYGDAQPDGTCDGWLVFFPVGGGAAIASDRGTTQATFQALTLWAAGLTPAYIEAALARALALAYKPAVLAQLEDAEYEALEDAERLETAAEIERVRATADEIAAAEARADAERLRRERLATESAIAATEEVAATKAAEAHEEAAREARAVAADAARRSRDAQTDTMRPKTHRSTKKR
jgi:hypothetical protein